MKENLDYNAWLLSLKTGSQLKTSNCSHNHGCNCHHLVVTGIVEMFGYDVISVANGCSIEYFDRRNGRRLGARKNTYKDGNIIPWYQEDQDKMDEATQKKHQEEKKRVLLNSIQSYLAGRETVSSNYHMNNVVGQATNEHLEKVLELLEAGLPKPMLIVD